ncbi:seryl-tRNA synthetase [Cutibacterium acnes JCM 18920]|nr:seryl-tRNA synthetase [Cutibacterium acnes JCM 18918]GAE79378.1 seryl-tRNA synthetase [Cutibacterium acnes JCM 18920]
MRDDSHHHHAVGEPPAADGSVRIPEALRPYLGGREFIEPVK